MIRYYTITGDDKRGRDFEYTFHHLDPALKKYDEVANFEYKSLTATDDKLGDQIIKRESK